MAKEQVYLSLMFRSAVRALKVQHIGPDTGHGGGVVDIKLKIALLQSLAMFFFDFFKPRRRLEVENLFLRHQLSIACGMRHLAFDCAAVTGCCWMTQLWPGLLGAAQVVQPETILRLHRAGF